MALLPGRNKPDDAEAKAGRKAAQDDALLREVDDAVRQDQYATFGKHYGKPLLALLVVGLVAFGGYLFWDSRQEAGMEEDSEVLVSALDQVQAGNLRTGSDRLDDLSGSGNDAARSAALMLQAGTASERGDLERAAQLFGRVSTDESAPQAYRDLATVRMAAAQFDTAQPDQIIARLGPMARPGNPYFGSAGELVAMAQLEKGNRREAGRLFAEIARSENVPESLRSRARQMAGVLGVDAIEDVDEVLNAVGADREAPANAAAAAAAR